VGLREVEAARVQAPGEVLSATDAVRAPRGGGDPHSGGAHKGKWPASPPSAGSTKRRRRLLLCIVWYWYAKSAVVAAADPHAIGTALSIRSWTRRRRVAAAGRADGGKPHLHDCDQLRQWQPPAHILGGVVRKVRVDEGTGHALPSPTWGVQRQLSEVPLTAVVRARKVAHCAAVCNLQAEPPTAGAADGLMPLAARVKAAAAVLPKHAATLDAFRASDAPRRA